MMQVRLPHCFVNFCSPCLSLTHLLRPARTSGESGERAKPGEDIRVNNPLDGDTRQKEQDGKTGQLNSDTKSTSCNPALGEKVKNAFQGKRERESRSTAVGGECGGMGRSESQCRCMGFASCDTFPSALRQHGR